MWKCSHCSRDRDMAHCFLLCGPIPMQCTYAIRELKGALGKGCAGYRLRACVMGLFLALGSNALQKEMLHCVKQDLFVGLKTFKSRYFPHFSQESFPHLFTFFTVLKSFSANGKLQERNAFLG